jgi:hypothetical protein
VSHTPFISFVAAVQIPIAIVCLGLLFFVDATSITGVHPALKPLKFAVSVSIFLATLAVIIPMLNFNPGLSKAVDATLAATMVVEMAVIIVQAARGTTSHFNVETPADAAAWAAMGIAITVMVVIAIGLAVAAWAGPITWRGAHVSPAIALSIRLGLTVFLLSAVSGYMMAGRGAHTVGGVDGGSGLAFVNWSNQFGDLRVSHFLSMHRIQFLPAVALGGTLAGLRDADQVTLVVVAFALYAGLAVATLVQAMMGQPLLAAR